jgi:hypothetical protein
MIQWSRRGGRERREWRRGSGEEQLPEPFWAPPEEVPSECDLKMLGGQTGQGQRVLEELALRRLGGEVRLFGEAGHATESLPNIGGIIEEPLVDPYRGDGEESWRHLGGDRSCDPPIGIHHPCWLSSPDHSSVEPEGSEAR